MDGAWSPRIGGTRSQAPMADDFPPLRLHGRGAAGIGSRFRARLCAAWPAAGAGKDRGNELFVPGVHSGAEVFHVGRAGGGEIVCFSQVAAEVVEFIRLLPDADELEPA